MELPRLAIVLMRCIKEWVQSKATSGAAEYGSRRAVDLPQTFLIQPVMQVLHLLVALIYHISKEKLELLQKVVVAVTLIEMKWRQQRRNCRHLLLSDRFESSIAQNEYKLLFLVQK